MYNSYVIHSFRHDVVMDQSLIALQEFINQTLDCDRFVVFCDSNTAIHCLPLFMQQIKLKKPLSVIQMPAGELSKNLTEVSRIWQEFTEQGIGRNAICINLGGGVVTDLGGFAASLYKRGIRFINIPTSLLAMVDASVGGKTGIDFMGLKNQIGLFSFPLRVFVSTAFLQSLPKHELLAGTAEMFKHGLLEGGKHWEEICQLKPEEIQGRPGLIADSIRIKNKMVTLDPFDTHGRKALNLGHTIGHALEAWALTNQAGNTLLHGEAVALGLLAESFLAKEHMDLNQQLFTTIQDWVLQRFHIPDFNMDVVLDCLKHDKKNKENEVNFSLLKSLGSVQIDVPLKTKAIRASLQHLKSLR